MVFGLVAVRTGGGGGGWHDAMVLFSSAAGGAYWRIAIRRPSLEPFPSISGAHRHTHPSFTLVGCANRAPGLSLFHCSDGGGGDLIKNRHANQR